MIIELNVQNSYGEVEFLQRGRVITERLPRGRVVSER